MDLNEIIAAILNPGGRNSAGGMPPMPSRPGEGTPQPAMPMQAFQQAPMQASMRAQTPQQQGAPQQGGFGQAIGGLLQGLVDPQASGRNQTVGWLTKQGLDEGTATLLAANKPALQSYLLQRSRGNGPTEFDQRAAAAQQYGLDPRSDEGRAFILGGKTPESPNMREQFGLNPIYGKDKAGNLVVMQPSKTGGLVQADLPEGVTLQPGVQKIDLGTEWGITDRSGVVIQRIPKDLAGAARDTAAGKGQGEAVASYESIKSKMPGLEHVVVQLDKLADDATYTSTGQAIDIGRRELGMEPRDAAVARTRYIAIVDNQILPLLRDTFGAQFTVQEGESLRATLGDKNKTPKEKQAVLKSFIEQKRRDVEALARQSGQVIAPLEGNPAGPAQPGLGEDPLGIR